MILSFLEYPIYFWQLVSGVRSNYETTFAKLRSDDTTEFLSSFRYPRILDLGNGLLRPQFAILKDAGYHVYGIDLANQPKRSMKNFLYVIARWLYNRRSSIRMNSARGSLVCGDVAKLPFRNDSFDLITSVAALEH